VLVVLSVLSVESVGKISIRRSQGVASVFLYDLTESS
jgi:hypothetical protein